MSKSPYYQVYIRDTSEDLTKYIDGITHEDCLEEDDLLKFKLTDINSEFIDNTSLTKGTALIFQYGYLSYKITNAATAIVKKISPKFSDVISMEIECLDRGANMKRNSYSKIWKGQTTTQIIETIVKKYGLSLVGDKTTKVYANLPQGNRTDFEFIRYLTNIEQNGSYIFYIKELEAFFVKRDLKKEPRVTYTYNDGTGKVISFDPVEDDGIHKNAKGKTKTTNVNPDTGEVIKAESTPDTQKEAEGFLGENTDIGLSSATAAGIKYSGDSSGNLTIESSENIPFPSKTTEEANNVVNSENKKASITSLTATLTIEGDTIVKAGDLISIAGVPKKYAGVWRVIKAIHKISNSGYITTLELDRNVSTTTTKKSEINKQTGPKDNSVALTEQKTVYRYDENGKKIGTTGTGGSF